MPRQRQALCRHVDPAVGTAVQERSEPSSAVDLLAEGSADAASALLDAAVQIWRAYRRAGGAGHESIIAAMEDTRWRDYAEVSMSR